MLLSAEKFYPSSTVAAPGSILLVEEKEEESMEVDEDQVTSNLPVLFGSKSLFPCEMERMNEFLTVNLVRLVKDLMTVVSIEEINHENICCLNTAVVIFVFQHRRLQIPILLDALRKYEEKEGRPGFICENFRSLLWFWIQYYTPRGRDRLSLEHSSEMKFEEWRHVVALLCADDGSETSLLSQPKKLPPSPYTRLYQLTLKRQS